MLLWVVLPDIAARVGAPHYRNTQFRKWSYLGAGCWLRTFLSLIWFCICVVKGGRGTEGELTLSPEIHFLFLARSRSTKRLVLTPSTSILAHGPHLGRANTHLHTHTPQLHASIADFCTMSSIWFSFTPENQNNPRRRRGWQLRRITEWQDVRGWVPQKGLFLTLGLVVESNTSPFSHPTLCVALAQTSLHIPKQHAVSISGQTYTISGDEEREGEGLLVFRGETPQKRICNSAAGGCNYSGTLQQDKERK